MDAALASGLLGGKEKPTQQSRGSMVDAKLAEKIAGEMRSWLGGSLAEDIELHDNPPKLRRLQLYLFQVGIPCVSVTISD